MPEFTETEIVKHIKNALKISKGDDLERAERSFKGTDLTEQHGQSGQTRGEILEGYIKRERLHQESTDWVEQHSQEE